MRLNYERIKSHLRETACDCCARIVTRGRRVVRCPDTGREYCSAFCAFLDARKGLQFANPRKGA